MKPKQRKRGKAAPKPSLSLVRRSRQRATGPCPAGPRPWMTMPTPISERGWIGDEKAPP